MSHSLTSLNRFAMMKHSIAALLALVLSASWSGVTAQDEAEAAVDGARPEAEASPSPSRDRNDWVNQDGSIVSIRKNGYLAPNRSVKEMVTILGSSRAEGKVTRELVTILGNVELEGSVGREMVTILGNARVNGEVEREVVVVLGNLELGPQADVNDITVVGGAVEQHPDARVSGSFNEVPIYIPFLTDGWEDVHPYIYEGLALGRFVVPRIGWTWMFAAVTLGVFVLLVAAFPKPATACVDAMERKPAQSIVAGFAFQLVGLPLVSIIVLLLISTVVGILAIPFLWMAFLFMWLLSFIAVYGVIGRRFGAKENIVFATLIGGILMTLFYAVPALGFIAALSISVVGSGAVIVAVFSAMPKNGRIEKRPLERRYVSRPAAVESATETTAPGAETIVSGADGMPRTETEEPSESGERPSPESGGANEAYEPVGFGPRFLAALIDFVFMVFCLVALEAFGGLDLLDNLLLPWLGYHLVFWMWRGTTLGGIALGLKLDRVNGEELNFGVALVRALASIISFVCLGIGFFWASWDAERQSWHDKIAGTVIVRVPKGLSLI